MLNNLPVYVTLIFALATLAAGVTFLAAVKNASLEATRQKAISISTGLFIWLVLQAALALKGIYATGINRFPPATMMVGIFPALAGVVLLFAMPVGRHFLDSLSLKHLTWLHSVHCQWFRKQLPEAGPLTLQVLIENAVHLWILFLWTSNWAMGKASAFSIR
jgi:ATP/ADP translocase